MSKNSPLFMEVGQGLSLMIGLPRITSWKTDRRPKNARRGTFGYNTETNNLEYFDGSNWFAASMDEI